MEIVQSVLGKLGFDWQVAIANLINFLIIYFLLKKFVFDKLADAIAERKIKAEANIALRQTLDEEMASFEKVKSDKLQEIKKEQNNVLIQAEQEKQKIIEAAEVESRAINKRAIDDGEKEKTKIIDSVADEIKDLSFSLSEKVLAAYQEKPDADKIKALLKDRA